MKTTVFSKIATTVSAVALASTIGVQEAKATTLEFLMAVPITSGAPYDPTGSTGQDFANWSFSGTKVTNNGASTRTWTVPISGFTSTGGSAINQIAMLTKCSTGSNVTASIYDGSGNIVHINSPVACNGGGHVAPLSPGVLAISAPSHTIAVSYSLAPGATAVSLEYQGWSP